MDIDWEPTLESGRLYREAGYLYSWSYVNTARSPLHHHRVGHLEEVKAA